MSTVTEDSMVQIRHILCPVDFSDFSLRALKQAVVLAGAHGGDVEALHVMPLHMPPVSGLAMAAAGVLEPNTRERMRMDLRERLAEFVAPAADGVPVETIVEEGNVVNQIVTQARARGVDLIVVGTHGHGGFERLTLGSTAEKTQRKAPCPVLTVPAGPDGAPSPALFRRILCAVDFSEPSGRALEYALALARESDGRVLLVHVLESVPSALHTPAFGAFDVRAHQDTLESEARTRLRGLVPTEGDRWTEGEEVRVGRAHDEILMAAEEHGSDLVVMGVRGHSAFENALFGSTAYHVAHRAACPVLSVRGREAREP
jgi:nucleotide-binding universal stress UspA family protein